MPVSVYRSKKESEETQGLQRPKEVTGVYCASTLVVDTHMTIEWTAAVAQTDARRCSMTHFDKLNVVLLDVTIRCSRLKCPTRVYTAVHTSQSEIDISISAAGIDDSLSQWYLWQHGVDGARSQQD